MVPLLLVLVLPVPAPSAAAAHVVVVLSVRVRVRALGVCRKNKNNVRNVINGKKIKLLILHPPVVLPHEVV